MGWGSQLVWCIITHQRRQRAFQQQQEPHGAHGVGHIRGGGGEEGANMHHVEPGGQQQDLTRQCIRGNAC